MVDVTLAEAGDAVTIEEVSEAGAVPTLRLISAAEREVDSPTGAMRDFYAHHTREMDAARATLAPRPGQVGALVFLGRRWLGLDLLPSPGLCERAWPRLCAGYAAEAVGRKRRVSAPPAVGLGREHRLAGNAVAGAALVVEDTVAHLMAFPVEA